MSFLFRFHDIIGGIHVPVDDGVDKLNRKYTLLVFLFLALPIFTKQYIGDPIECFAPVYFAEHQSRYINSYCWTQSTYYMVPLGDPDDDGDQQEPPDRIMPDEVDYFIGFETVTHIGNERLRRVRVSYYQWAPLILLAQGLCFYIPFLIWNSCANNAGVKLRRLLKKASDIASLPPGCQQREALLAEFVDQFHTLVTGEAGWCADLQCGGLAGAPSVGASGGGGGSSANSSASSASSASAAASHHQQANGQVGGGGRSQGQNRNAHDDDHRRSHNHHQAANRAAAAADQQQAGCCLASIPLLGPLLACCLRPCSSLGLVVGPSKYLCLLYLAVKFAYVFNVGLQFFLLGKFLGHGYLRHGLELINRLLVNGEWWASPRFPLSTLCQVRADMSGGLRTYTCQCVLPINVFNEKIFSVVWFYMAFLLPLNVLSLLFWVYRTFETNRMSYIRLCLWRTRLVELNQIHRTVRRLSQSYLGWDGVFLLRLIEHNHGSIMATLIMSRLWEFYANQIKLQEDANQLALASNAQHTLSNITTTAMGNPHNNNNTSNHVHNHNTSAHHNHTHHAHHQHPQQQHQQHQYLTNQPHSQQQQQHSHAATHHHHHHGGGGPPPPHHPVQPIGHGPGAHPFGAHPAPLQPTLATTAAANHFAATGASAHHSGQISQAPAHHPLHAANTAGAHHVHHAAAAAAAAAAGPHLSGAFTSANANLLAQLQHQAAVAQQQQQHQQHQQHQQQQQQPPGNVAAAVAALAAAAAAATNNQPGGASSATTAPAVVGATKAAATTTTTVPGAATNSSASATAIHLQSLKTAAAAGQQAAASITAAAAAVANNKMPAASSKLLGAQATTAAAATTSFITAAQQQQQASGPPLPPPPPAHVVAAVAAASAAPATSQAVAPPPPPLNRTSGGGGGKTLTTQPTTTNTTTTNTTATTTTTTTTTTTGTHSNLFNLKSSNQQQNVQLTSGSVVGAANLLTPTSCCVTSSTATTTTTTIPTTTTTAASATTNGTKTIQQVALVSRPTRPI